MERCAILGPDPLDAHPGATAMNAISWPKFDDTTETEPTLDQQLLTHALALKWLLKSGEVAGTDAGVRALEALVLTLMTFAGDVCLLRDEAGPVWLQATMRTMRRHGL